MLSNGELLILITGTIGALASAVVTIVNGISSKKTLKLIHQDTNGNLTSVRRELATVSAVLMRRGEEPSPRTYRKQPGEI